MIDNPKNNYEKEMNMYSCVYSYNNAAEENISVVLEIYSLVASDRMQVSQNFVCQNLTTLTTNIFEDYGSTENFNKKNTNLWVQY